jgi:hypothetical protein
MRVLGEILFALLIVLYFIFRLRLYRVFAMLIGPKSGKLH